MAKRLDEAVLKGALNMARFYTYDSPEAIQKCLNCEKPDCTNCLGYIFFETVEDEKEGENDA